MLINTDVLIWMTRDHAGAAARLQTLTPWRISSVTYRLPGFLDGGLVTNPVLIVPTGAKGMQFVTRRVTYQIKAKPVSK